MSIDALLSQVRENLCNTGATDLVIGKNWSQGRTAYGGISAALIYQAIKLKISGEPILRAFNVSFVGPLAVEQPFAIQVEILRQGKNVTQVLGRAVQDGNTCLLCQASFGVHRESKVQVENTRTPKLLPPKKPNFLPIIPKVTPKFIGQIDLAIMDGKIPFMGSKQSSYGGWMRFKQPPENITDAHLIALADAWPPAVLQMLRWPAPASSLTWNLEFVHPHQPVAPTDWFAYRVDTVQAADGYGHEEASIWDAQGELVALSRQVVTVFDK